MAGLREIKEKDSNRFRVWLRLKSMKTLLLIMDNDIQSNTRRNIIDSDFWMFKIIKDVNSDF